MEPVKGVVMRGKRLDRRTVDQRDRPIVLGVSEGSFGAGLERVLRERGEDHVITTSNAQFFRQMVLTLHPRVVMIDGRMAGSDLGSMLELIRLVAPAAQVIVLLDSMPPAEEERVTYIYLSREAANPRTVAQTIDHIIRLDPPGGGAHEAVKWEGQPD